MSSRESASLRRPDDLPNYDTPPINEVIVGVQYGPPDDFSMVKFGEVHDLFKSRFPDVQEKPCLEPRIETFGGVDPFPAAAPKSLVHPVPPRLWFLSEDGSHLLQFQKDTFLLNWMRRGPKDTYPRFEKICDLFMDCLGKLRAYYSDVGHKIVLSQAEVMYVNTIPVSDFRELSDWLSVGLLSDSPVSSLNFASEEVLLDDEGHPTQRLYMEINSAHAREGAGKAYRLRLTVRGIPRSESESASVDLRGYLSMCRCQIVKTFDKIITKQAQEKWGRRS